MLICLFMISFGTNTSAAADLIYDGVDFDSKIEAQNLPIKVTVKFIWGTGPSVQTMNYVWLDYDIKPDIVEGEFRVEYKSPILWVEYDRPTSVILTIPAGDLDENDTVYFKISYQYDKFGEKDIIERPSRVHKVNIYCEGGIAEEEGDQMILYIILGSAAAIVLIALFVMYTIRRRR